jgi:hypothetical protein
MKTMLMSAERERKQSRPGDRERWKEVVSGVSWREMPGYDLDAQRINFALWRRGLLDPRLVEPAAVLRERRRRRLEWRRLMHAAREGEDAGGGYRQAAEMFGGEVLFDRSADWCGKGLDKWDRVQLSVDQRLALRARVLAARRKAGVHWNDMPATVGVGESAMFQAWGADWAMERAVRLVLIWADAVDGLRGFVDEVNFMRRKG